MDCNLPYIRQRPLGKMWCTNNVGDIKYVFLNCRTAFTNESFFFITAETDGVW
jgi:hypothetical protein